MSKMKDKWNCVFVWLAVALVTGMSVRDGRGLRVVQDKARCRQAWVVRRPIFYKKWHMCKEMTYVQRR